MTRTTLPGLALCGLLIGSAVLASGCSGMPCECDPDVLPLPDNGDWMISDVEVEDHFNGGGSEQWDWSHLSPWGDVFDGEVRMESGQLFVEYTTPHGTFLVTFDETDSAGF